MCAKNGTYFTYVLWDHSRSKPLIPEVPSFRMSHTWPHGSHKIWPRSKGCLKKYPYSFYTVQLYTYYDSYDYVIVLHTKALLTFTWHELMLQLTNSGSSLEIASLTPGCITSSNWKALAPAGSRPLWRGLAPLRRRVGRFRKNWTKRWSMSSSLVQLWIFSSQATFLEMIWIPWNGDKFHTWWETSWAEVVQQGAWASHWLLETKTLKKIMIRCRM